MARKSSIVFKRATTKKNRFAYYIQLLDAESGTYATARSAAMIARELHLDPKEYPPTSRTGAEAIGREATKRLGLDGPATQADPLFADYCASFWTWDTSTYIAAQLARGFRIGKEYCQHNLSYIERFVRPAFPKVKLSAVQAYELEDFAYALKKTTTLHNASINRLIACMAVPLGEAFRRRLIKTNIGASIRPLANDSEPRGIPTESEMLALLSMTGLDPRVRAAVFLGAACALRLGEIQAIQPAAIGATSLTVAHSWGKVEGLKSTKTNSVRIVPLPKAVREALLELMESNPHEDARFVFYGDKADAPLDNRWIERGFDEALVRVTLGQAADAPGDRLSGETMPVYKARCLARRTSKADALASWKARRITFHSLRHWSNSRLRGAVTDEKLRKLTGHSTAKMTEHYDHALEEDMRALAGAQDARIVPFFGTPE